MARQIEPVPYLAGQETGALRRVPPIAALAERRFDKVEETRPEPPEERGDPDSQQMVADDALLLAAAVNVRGEDDERHDEQQIPAPGEFNEIFVENVVGSGQIRFGHGQDIGD